jgi:hypothetical protein
MMAAVSTSPPLHRDDRHLPSLGSPMSLHLATTGHPPRTRTTGRRRAGLLTRVAVTAPVLLVPLHLAACSGASAEPSRPAAAVLSTSASASSRVDRVPVAGFPTRMVPVPPGATVTASAVEPAAGVLKVSLTGTSPASVQQILDFYHSTLLGEGFTATSGNVLPAGASGAAYSRGGDTELLIVAVADDGVRRSFSIGGTVRV